MKKITWTTTLVLALVTASGLVFAQPPGPPPGGPPGPPPGQMGAGPPMPPPGQFGDGPPMPPPEMTAENRELLEQVMVGRLSREMDLTDEQSILFMRRFGDLRKQQQELRQERMEIMRELRPVLKKQEDEAALDRLMGRIEALNERSAAAEQTIRDSFSDLNLNIWQKAKLELFLSDFENQMRRIVQQAHGGRMGPDRPGQLREGGRPVDGPRRQGPGAPGDGPPQDRPRRMPRQGQPEPPVE